MAKLIAIAFTLTLSVAGCDFNSGAMSPQTQGLQTGSVVDAPEPRTEEGVIAPAVADKAPHPSTLTEQTTVLPAETTSQAMPLQEEAGDADETSPGTDENTQDEADDTDEAPVVAEEDTPTDEEDLPVAPAENAEDATVDVNSECGMHDRFGMPDEPEAVLCRMDYAVGFSVTRKAAVWVSYHVTAEGAAMDIERTDDFRTDKSLVAAGQAKLSDYKGSGFDRGHMFPAALATTDEAMSETFLLSNITPQLPGFNRYGWKDLEAWVRGCAEEVGELDVVTGAIYDEDLTHVGDGVQIADAFYKIVHYEGKVQAFLVMHAKADMDDVAYWEITEEELEAIAGVDFFPGKVTSDATVCSVD